MPELNPHLALPQHSGVYPSSMPAMPLSASDYASPLMPASSLSLSHFQNHLSPATSSYQFPSSSVPPAPSTYGVSSLDPRLPPSYSHLNFPGFSMN
jgi:hypothetical protein